MIGSLKRFILRNLVSPYGLAFLSYCFFLFAWFFPPSLYTQLMREPDYMFLNWRSLAFCSLCIAAFLIGAKASRLSLASIVFFLFRVRITGYPSAPVRQREGFSQRFRSRPLPLLIPIVLSALLGCITLAVIGIKTDSFSLILAEQAQLIKDTNATPVDLSFWGKLIPLGPIHMAIIWWFAFRLRQAEVSEAARRYMKATLWIAVVVAMANSIAHAERVTLMPILVGLFPVWLFTSVKTSKDELWPLLKPIALGAAAVLAFFFLLSLLRGNVQIGDAAQLVLGYTFSSYNRLAAALDGSLKYTYAGNVQDLCAFCTSNKYLNSVFPYAQFFHIPDALTTWATDFVDTGSAGLVGGYTFASAFTYIFRDIGWWAPLYFVLQGLIVGRAWQSFRNGRVFGLMLYPWCAFSVLFWFGFNIFFNDAFFYIVAGAIVLEFYEKFIFGRTCPAGDDGILPHKAINPIADFGGN